MGCIQVRVEPDNSMDKNEPKKSKLIVSQAEIIRNISGKPDKSKTYPMAMYRKPLSVLRPLVVRSIISTKSKEFTQHSELVVSTTLVKPTKSNDYQNTGINKTLVESGESTPLNNANISPTSIDSRERSISRLNVRKSVDMDSPLSDIPEVSSMTTISSNKLDQRSSIYSFDSSSSPDLEHKVYRKDTINRLSFATPNLFNDHQASTQDNICSESSDSYSLRDSFVTPISADSEGSLIDWSKGGKTIFVRPKKSNVQRKTFANEALSESDETLFNPVTRNNSAFRDTKVMADHSVTVLRSASTRLSNPDYH